MRVVWQKDVMAVHPERSNQSEIYYYDYLADDIDLLNDYKDFGLYVAGIIFQYIQLAVTFVDSISVICNSAKSE
jgi:hypothetical protein